MKRQRTKPAPQSPFANKGPTHNLTEDQMAHLVYSAMTEKNWLRISKAMMHAIGDRETIMLSELISLDMGHRKKASGDFDGWFRASGDLLEYATAQGKDVRQRTLGKLEKLNIIKSKKAGLPATNHYRIDYGRIPELFNDDHLPTSGGDFLPKTEGFPPTGGGDSLPLYIEGPNKKEEKEVNTPPTPPNGASHDGKDLPTEKRSSASHKEDKLVGNRSIRYWPKEFISNQAFRTLWEEWCEYRSSSPKPIEKLNKIGFKRMVSKVLNEVGSTPAQVIEAIENSMAMGWRGIYRPNNGNLNGRRGWEHLPNGDRILHGKNGKAHCVGYNIPANGGGEYGPHRTVTI